MAIDQIPDTAHDQAMKNFRKSHPAILDSDFEYVRCYLEWLLGERSTTIGTMPTEGVYLICLVESVDETVNKSELRELFQTVQDFFDESVIDLGGKSQSQSDLKSQEDSINEVVLLTSFHSEYSGLEQTGKDFFNGILNQVSGENVEVKVTVSKCIFSGLMELCEIMEPNGLAIPYCNEDQVKA